MLAYLEHTQGICSSTGEGRLSVAPPSHQVEAVVTVLAIGALLAAVGAWSLFRAGGPKEVRHLEVSFPTDAALVEGRHFALSPEGRRIVYSGLHEGKVQLFVRDLERIEPRPVAGTEGAVLPVFSPDGSEVAFHVREFGPAGGTIRKVPVEGGTPLDISF